MQQVECGVLTFTLAQSHYFKMTNMLPVLLFLTLILAQANPLTLTSSDGSGLTLVSLKVKGVIENPLSFTQMELEFENPENRRIEGNTKIIRL